MVNRIVTGVLLLVLTCCAVSAQVPVFINEIHYDNVGADVAEGVEIAGPAGTNLACFRIYLYNGAAPGAAVVYDSVMLSGVIPDQCNGFGTLNFPVNLPAQIQNGPNDGFALVYNPSYPGCGLPGLPYVVQLLSYEGAFTCANGPAIGMTATDIGVFEASGTAVGQSLQLTGAGSLYSDFTWAGVAAATPGALNNGQTFGGSSCGGGPVIPTELRFTSTPGGCILPGGTFSIQVCATNASGFTAISYASPITISLISGPGVLSGTTTQSAVFGCATFSGLSLSAPGTYQFRATDGVWADTSAFVYISSTCTTCPNLNAVLVDACGVQEGRNEILFFNTGDFAIPVNSSSIVVNYGSTTPPTTGYTNSLTSNQTYVNALNATAGCSIFHDALSNSPIPPNTNFIVMSYTPLTTYDFSAWCSLGDVYVVFSDDTDWDTTNGNWKNCLDCAPGDNGNNPRYFRTNFSGLTNGGACDFNYNYIPCSDLVCSGNGDGLDFGYGGGTPTANWNECTPSSVLAVEFGLPFEAVREARNVRLSWQTLMEQNASHFMVQRASSPTGPFEILGRVNAVGNSAVPQDYNWMDLRTSPEQLWYRLQEYDLEGEMVSQQIATVAPLTGNAQVFVAQEDNSIRFDIVGKGAVRIEVMDIAGRVIARENGTAGEFRVDMSPAAAGMYCYRVVVGTEAFSGKLRIL